jgi:hypothetical protein
VEKKKKIERKRKEKKCIGRRESSRGRVGGARRCFLCGHNAMRCEFKNDPRRPLTIISGEERKKKGI